MLGRRRERPVFSAVGFCAAIFAKDNKSQPLGGLGLLRYQHYRLNKTSLRFARIIDLSPR